MVGAAFFAVVKFTRTQKGDRHREMPALLAGFKVEYIWHNRICWSWIKSFVFPWILKRKLRIIYLYTFSVLRKRCRRRHPYIERQKKRFLITKWQPITFKEREPSNTCCFVWEHCTYNRNSTGIKTTKQ